MKNEKNTIRRLIPCADYDVAGMESWLSQMALEGWHLSEEGFFMGFANFQRGQKQSVRYRLSAAQKQPGFFSDYRIPSDEEQELAADMGWEYVDTRGQFYIWRCSAPEAPELNTDIQVQVLALDKAIGRSRASFLSALVLVILHAVNAAFEYGLFTILLGYGAPLLVTLMFLALPLLSIGTLVSWLKLRKLKRHLLDAGELPTPGDRRKTSRRYWLGHLSSIFLVLLFFVLLFTRCSAELEGSHRESVENFEGELPFAALADFADGEYESRYTSFGHYNSYEEYRGLLARRAIHWSEAGEIRDESGSIVLDGILEVHYYECAAPWIAQQLAREYYWVNGPRGNDRDNLLTGDILHIHGPFFPEAGQLTLDIETDADHAFAFTDRRVHFPNVVIQKDNQLLCAQFLQFGENTLSLDEWASILADSFA